MPAFTESVVEDAALAWLQSLDWAVIGLRSHPAKLLPRVDKIERKG